MIPGIGISRKKKPPVGGGGGGTLLETVTLDNFSGQALTDPYISFPRFFVQGAVPSGTKLDVRQSGGATLALQQVDNRSTHADGSLKGCTISCKVPNGVNADFGTIALDLYCVTGSFNNSSAISRSTLTGRDYKMRVRIGGTDYYCRLNNLDAAGSWREIRAGSACRAWKHWGPFRTGQTAGGSDQGQFVGFFYSYVWSDGSITVMAFLNSGRLASAGDTTVQQCELLDGSTSLQLYTTSFTAYPHNILFFGGPNMLPKWFNNVGSEYASHWWTRFTTTYLHNTKLNFNIKNTLAMRQAIPAVTPVLYDPTSQVTDTVGPNAAPHFDSSFSADGTGQNWWIGCRTGYALQAVLANTDTVTFTNQQRKNLIHRIRAAAFASGVKFPQWWVSEVSGWPPVTTVDDFTALGLTASQNGGGAGGPWKSGGGPGDTSAYYPNATSNSSHIPDYWGMFNIAYGWEWGIDLAFMMRVGACCAEYDARINNITFRGMPFKFQGWVRGIAWTIRDHCTLDWMMPDNHPCRPYNTAMLTQGWDCMTQCYTAPYMAADRATMALWDPNIYPNDHTEYPSAPTPTTHRWAVVIFVWSHLMEQLGHAVWRGQLSLTHKLITEAARKCYFPLVSKCPYQTYSYYGVWITTGEDGSGPYAQSVNDNIFTTNDLTAIHPLDSDQNNTNAPVQYGSTCPISGWAGNGTRNQWETQKAVEICHYTGIISGASADALLAYGRTLTALVSDAAAASETLIQFTISQP